MSKQSSKMINNKISQASISIKINKFVFVSVVLICLVLYLKKLILCKIWILSCLVLLNRFLFLTLFV